MTVRAATVLGIGSMIGAGIFALLGVAGAVARAAFGCVLAVVAVVIIVTIVNLSSHLPAFRGDRSLSKIVASVALTFSPTSDSTSTSR